MKGYRTVAFNVLMAVVMGGTVQMSDLPPDVQHWLYVLTAVWTVVALALRMITNTPIGKKLEAKVESDFGLTDAQVQALVARLPVGTAQTLIAAVQKVQATLAQPVPKEDQQHA